jgi:hypothetical protein
MNAQDLTQKYIVNMEKTLLTMQKTQGTLQVNEQCVEEIFGYVTAYLQDAKYYWEQKQFETSLTSIAYCEGLFDALKLIGAVKVSPSP